jgi:hypothetical protein
LTLLAKGLVKWSPPQVRRRCSVWLAAQPWVAPFIGLVRTIFDQRIDAWTASSVREVLDNPKHTGHMVWWQLPEIASR